MSNVCGHFLLPDLESKNKRKMRICLPFVYDQRGAGDAASFVFDLNPKNHHFKSLGHNPSLLGLFFSVLDQFANTSHFISGGELISLFDADSSFYLRGSNAISKFFCAFVNWIGHLISDMSGSSGSRGSKPRRIRWTRLRRCAHTARSRGIWLPRSCRIRRRWNALGD